MQAAKLLAAESKQASLACFLTPEWGTTFGPLWAKSGRGSGVFYGFLGFLVNPDSSEPSAQVFTYFGQK